MAVENITLSASVQDTQTSAAPETASPLDSGTDTEAANWTIHRDPQRAPGGSGFLPKAEPDLTIQPLDDFSTQEAEPVHLGEPIIQMKNIVKTFYIGEPNELQILHGIDLTVRRGEFVAVVGQSGAGKSTLMNIIGVLDKPTSGEYILDGVDVARAKDRELSALSNDKIGFVFQTFNLVPRTSALKNVELPMLYAGVSRGERSRRAKELLGIVGMGDRMSHQPNELSGGQKQRVAIARAMSNDPAIILADEPTGALDSATGRLIMDLFHQLHKEQGKTIVLITHSNELAAETQRIVTISDGRIISERKGMA